MGIKVRVNNINGALRQSSDAIVLPNQRERIRSIEEIDDVSEVDVITGATLVYNEDTDAYEVKQLATTDLAGDFTFDGGTF